MQPVGLHASRSRVSFTERHHPLPAGADSGGASPPRLTCHRMRPEFPLDVRNGQAAGSGQRRVEITARLLSLK